MPAAVAGSCLPAAVPGQPRGLAYRLSGFPLHPSARSAVWLLKRANPEPACDRELRTAVHWAILRKHLGCLALLLESGLYHRRPDERCCRFLDAPDAGHWSPLAIALHYKCASWDWELGALCSQRWGVGGLLRGSMLLFLPVARPPASAKLARCWLPQERKRCHDARQGGGQHAAARAHQARQQAAAACRHRGRQRAAGDHAAQGGWSAGRERRVTACTWLPHKLPPFWVVFLQIEAMSIASCSSPQHGRCVEVDEAALALAANHLPELVEVLAAFHDAQQAAC